MNSQKKLKKQKFQILEEQGYDLEQFLCRCPSKTVFEAYLQKKRIKKDSLAVVTVSLIDPVKLAPTATKTITTTLGHLVSGLTNLNKLKKIMPEDPIAALYVISTNNVDNHKSKKEVETFCAKNKLKL